MLRHAAKRRPLRFGFNDADCITVDEEKVIGLAGLERELADGDARGRAEVQVVQVLHLPPRRIEHRVDLLARLFLWVH